MSVLLELRDVYISYLGVEAVRGVSLKVNESDFVTVIGANGAGKSSIFNTISGLVKPAKGEIWFNGERIDTLSAPQIAKKGVIQVPEGRKIFPLLTVMENLMVGAYMQKDKKKIAENLDKVYRLYPALKERPHAKGMRLSGGQQQMLAIGRALMANPKLILLDEPSLGLSPIFCKNLENQMKALQKEGHTLFLVEQNARMGLNLSNYAYVLENGELRKEGPSAQLLQDPDVIKAYLGV
ncbi:MAG: ABC transporter ATP-binding protein [Dehalococcoidia bacterium]|nr:ABC transporter ATP-binding protein [Dehalococcoidia bacterium]